MCERESACVCAREDLIILSLEESICVCVRVRARVCLCERKRDKESVCVYDEEI